MSALPDWESLRSAVESDIASLTLLIHTWPSTFTDLNAARDFVGQWFYDNKFRYAGWPDVALHKYRLFFNLTTAKSAHENGLFNFEQAIPKRESLNKLVSRGRDGRQKQEDEVKVLKVKGPVSEKEKDAHACGINSGPEDINNLDPDISNNNDEYGRSCPTASSEFALAEDDSLTQTMAELGLQGSAVADPFKEVVAQLQHSYILKAASD